MPVPEKQQPTHTEDSDPQPHSLPHDVAVRERIFVDGEASKQECNEEGQRCWWRWRRAVPRCVGVGNPFASSHEGAVDAYVFSLDTYGTLRPNYRIPLKVGASAKGALHNQESPKIDPAVEPVPHNAELVSVHYE
jgi:hypothetical protein